MRAFRYLFSVLWFSRLLRKTPARRNRPEKKIAREKARSKPYLKTKLNVPTEAQEIRKACVCEFSSSFSKDIRLLLLVLTL